MTAPVYREYEPRAALRPFVHRLWTFAAPADDAPQPIAPDGRPELIVHLREPYRERGAEGDVAQAPVLFAGQMTRPLSLIAQADPAVLGVRFHAWAAGAFLGANAAVATDRRLDLAALHGEAAVTLLRQTRACGVVEQQLEITQDYVQARLADARIDADVRAAVQALADNAEAAAPNAASERQRQRRFKAEVGVSPRMLQSVLRFRRVFDAIEHPETSGWVEAALAAGYFDQPHMARDFRRFLGCTARAWAAQRAGLATALAAPAPEPYKTAASDRPSSDARRN